MPVSVMLKSASLFESESPTPALATKWTNWIDVAIFICLAAIAICAPLTTKGATNAFRAATAIWLVKIFTGKVRFYRQPLALPLLLLLPMKKSPSHQTRTGPLVALEIGVENIVR